MRTKYGFTLKLNQKTKINVWFINSFNNDIRIYCSAITVKYFIVEQQTHI